MIAALALLAALRLAAGDPPETCSLTFDPPATLVWRGRAGGGYDPLDPAERWQNARFTVRHQGPACEFWVAAEDLGLQGERSAAAAGGELRYRIADGEGRPPSEAGVYGAALAAGRFGEGTAAAEFELRVTLPPGQASPPGDYRDTVVLRLFAGPAGSLDPVATALHQLRFEVGASLELELGSPGGELDLGELADGAAGGIRLRVRGNAPYRLSVKSANQGFLQAENGGGARIAYRLQLAGAPLSLAGELELAGEAPGAAGRELELEIAVPPAAGAVAGSYRDTLVFSVAAD